MRAKLLTLVAVAGLSIAGCGGGSDEDRIRDAATDFTVAFADGDYKRVCELMTGEAKRKLVALGRGGCEQVMGLAGDALDDAERDQLRDAEVTQVTITGDRAEVVQTSGSEQVDPLQLAKRGDEWLVDADRSTAAAEGSASPPEGAETPAAAASTVAQGEALSLDDYSVTVADVERASELPGGEYSSSPVPAEGEFLILTVEIRNTGTADVIYNVSSVRLEDSAGTVHEPNEGGAQYQHETLPGSIDERKIVAGSTETGKIAYDLPAGADGVRAQFTSTLQRNSEDFTGTVTLR